MDKIEPQHVHCYLSRHIFTNKFLVEVSFEYLSPFLAESTTAESTLSIKMEKRQNGKYLRNF